MPTEEEILQSLRPRVSTATLSAAALKAQQARDLELEIADLEERLASCKAQLHNIFRVEMPELMDQAQTDRIGIPADGNRPAYDLRLSPYYKANIAANWSEERRQAALNSLTELGHQDLIKTQITITLPRDQRSKAQDLLKQLASFHPEIQETVHWRTLTAWLQEQYERGNPTPPLDVIGAEVGRVVKMTERRS